MNPRRGGWERRRCAVYFIRPDAPICHRLNPGKKFYDFGVPGFVAKASYTELSARDGGLRSYLRLSGGYPRDMNWDFVIAAAMGVLFDASPPHWQLVSTTDHIREEDGTITVETYNSQKNKFTRTPNFLYREWFRRSRVIQRKGYGPNKITDVF